VCQHASRSLLDHRCTRSCSCWRCSCHVQGTCYNISCLLVNYVSRTRKLHQWVYTLPATLLYRGQAVATSALLCQVSTAAALQIHACKLPEPAWSVPDATNCCSMLFCMHCSCTMSYMLMLCRCGPQSTHDSHTQQLCHSLHACHMCSSPCYQENDHRPKLLASCPKYLVCCCHEHRGPVSHNMPEVGVHLHHVLCNWSCNLANQICWL
jgi:hypothetical protein